MNKSRYILQSRNVFIALLFFIAAVLAILAPKSAVNVDEQLHYPHAKKVVNWYFSGGKDQSCLNTPRSHLKYYGQSVDNFTALVSRVFDVKDEFILRHYTGALFFLLLLLFTGLLAKRLSNSWSTAIFSVLALVFMPRLAGQAFGNLKDIPFATGYMAGILFIIKFLEELPRPRWGTALLLGVSIAFTVSVRSGGLILFAFLLFFLVLFFVFKPYYLEVLVTKKYLFSRLLAQGVSILIIGYFAGLIFWPYALQDILLNPLESLHVMEHYKVTIRQVFEGEWIWSTHLPWYYLPKWILISTPGFVLSGFVFFIFFYSRDVFRSAPFSQQMFFQGVVLFAFIFPFLYVILIGSNLYSGVRQMFFIFPPMAVLSVCGIYRLLKFVGEKNKTIASVLFVLFFFLLVYPLKHQAKTFPADYIYFNHIGGKHKAWANYEYDYYFHGLKEPAEYLKELVTNKEVTVAMNCNLYNYFSNNPNIKYRYTRFLERSSYDWDYALFGVGYIHPYLLKNNLWMPAEILKIFYHNGNPVAIILKRKDKSDFKGISEIKDGNFIKGEELLQAAIDKCQNNVWLYVYMAKAKLATGDIEGFEYYIEKGKEIYPFYEPFYLLEARRLFQDRRYEESLELLNKLHKINSYYEPAKSLYEKVLTKLN